MVVSPAPPPPVADNSCQQPPLRSCFQRMRRPPQCSGTSDFRVVLCGGRGGSGPRGLGICGLGLCCAALQVLDEFRVWGSFCHPPFKLPRATAEGHKPERRAGQLSVL